MAFFFLPTVRPSAHERDHAATLAHSALPVAAPKDTRACGVFGVEFITPLSISREPIDELLESAGDECMTRRWLEAKNQELAYVGVTSAIIASLFGSAFSWPAAASAPWLVQACWYCGLIFTLASIATATQQSVMLHRISCSSNYIQHVCSMLGYYDETRRGMKTRALQPFVWQIPVMNLRFGVYMLLAGLFLMLWDAARVNHNWTSNESKTAIIFSATIAFVLICHGLSIYLGYSRIVSGKRRD